MTTDKPSNINEHFVISQYKKQEYGPFQKYLIIVTSCIFSIIYSTILCSGAVICHFYDKLFDRETKKIDSLSEGDLQRNGYTPRKPYDNIDSMKPTSELRYYLLELGLDLEEYSVNTPDGYILVLHHIIDPKESVEVRKLRKPAFLQHGLLSCSGAFIATGKNSLAYYLHNDLGYDVFLGNNRSWFRAQSTQFSGNLYNNEMYWKWGIKELAYIDLPCFIETVMNMKKPNHDKLILFGHSQGGLESFLMLRNPQLTHIHEQIELFVPLAAAVYPGYLFHTRSFIRILCMFPDKLWLYLFGFCAMLRNLCLVRYYICHTWLFGKLSYYMFKFLFNWTSIYWGTNAKVWHFCSIFNMSYVSVELMKYYLCKANPVGFVSMLQPKQAFNPDDLYSASDLQACTKDDSGSFFPYRQSWFADANLKIKVPMMVVIGEEDFLVDGRRLYQHMKDFEPDYEPGINLELVAISRYNHLDVCWAEDVIGTIGYPMREFLSRLSLKKVGKEKSSSEERELISTEDSFASSVRAEDNRMKIVPNGHDTILSDLQTSPRYVKKFVAKTKEEAKEVDKFGATFQNDDLIVSVNDGENKTTIPVF